MKIPSVKIPELVEFVSKGRKCLLTKCEHVDTFERSNAVLKNKTECVQNVLEGIKSKVKELPQKFSKADELSEKELTGVKNYILNARTGENKFTEEQAEKTAVLVSNSNKEFVKYLMEVRNGSLSDLDINGTLIEITKDNKDTVKHLFEARNGEIDLYYIAESLQNTGKDAVGAVKELVEARNQSIDESKIPDILKETNKKSIKFLKHFLEVKENNSYKYSEQNIVGRMSFLKDYSKSQELFENPAKFNQFLDDYKSLENIEDSRGMSLLTRHGLKNILNLKYAKPEKYAEMMQLIKLSKEGIVPEYLFNNLTAKGEINANVLKDVKKVLNNESIVTEFLPLTRDEKILASSELSDVISKKGVKNIFVNEGNKLTQLDMDKDTYLKLFPPVKRFAWRQTIGNCHTVSPMSAFMEKPKARVDFYKMFKQEGNDIIVTLPGYPKYPVRFIDGKIELPKNKGYLRGNLAAQMVEQAYAITKYKTEKLAGQLIENPDLKPDINKAMNYINRGDDPVKVFKELFGKDVTAFKTQISIDGNELNLKELQKIFNKCAKNKDDYIFGGGTLDLRMATNEELNIVGGHANCISDFDTKKQTVKLKNPWNTGEDITLSYRDFLKSFFNFYCLKI